MIGIPNQDVFSEMPITPTKIKNRYTTTNKIIKKEAKLKEVESFTYNLRFSSIFCDIPFIIKAVLSVEHCN